MPRSSSEKDGRPAAADASSQNTVGGKQWKREIKRRLRREALLEIRPLAVGTLAMIGSALCNQGKFFWGSACCRVLSSWFPLLLIYASTAFIVIYIYYLFNEPNKYCSGPTPPRQGIGRPRQHIVILVVLCQRILYPIPARQRRKRLHVLPGCRCPWWGRGVLPSHSLFEPRSG